MDIKLILVIFGTSLIFADTNNMFSQEFYYPLDDNSELMFKVMFTKMNEILLGNQRITENVMEINKRQELQENLIKQLNENVTTLDETLDKMSSNMKLLKSNDEWTVIQRRQDGSVDFYNNWIEYKQGFGNPSGEFFIGLEKLHEMTSNGVAQELWITLRDVDKETRYAIYDNFVIGSEAEGYPIKELGYYRGNAGDSLRRHEGHKFTTKDNVDKVCAEYFRGAWWFKTDSLETCYASHLNGPYLTGQTGVAWGTFGGWNYSLQFTEMLIRQKP